MEIEKNKNALVVYSNTNVKGKKDSSGAFTPEAKAFCKVHGIPWSEAVGIKCPRIPKWKRRKAFYEGLRTVKNKPLDIIAIYGHGWPSGLQFGFNKTHIPELVQRIVENGCTNNLKIILYACLAAENEVRDTNHKDVGPGTDGGFADMLRDEMVRQGITNGHVDAHKTAGHTSWNPNLVRFLCEDVDNPEYGAVGGGWLVAPRSQFWRKWCKALRNNDYNLRHVFPFLSEFEIKQILDNWKVV